MNANRKEYSMYAILHNVRFNLSRVGEIHRIVEQEVLPNAGKLKGYVRSTYLRSVESDDTGIAITVFESGETARAAMAAIEARGALAADLIASQTMHLHELVGQSGD